MSDHQTLSFIVSTLRCFQPHLIIVLYVGLRCIEYTANLYSIYQRCCQDLETLGAILKTFRAVSLGMPFVTGKGCSVEYQICCLDNTYRTQIVLMFVYQFVISFLRAFPLNRPATLHTFCLGRRRAIFLLHKFVLIQWQFSSLFINL